MTENWRESKIWKETGRCSQDQLEHAAALAVQVVEVFEEDYPDARQGEPDGETRAHYTAAREFLSVLKTFLESS